MFLFSCVPFFSGSWYYRCTNASNCVVHHGEVCQLSCCSASFPVPVTLRGPQSASELRHTRNRYALYRRHRASANAWRRERELFQRSLRGVISNPCVLKQTATRYNPIMFTRTRLPQSKTKSFCVTLHSPKRNVRDFVTSATRLFRLLLQTNNY